MRQPRGGLFPDRETGTEGLLPDAQSRASAIRRLLHRVDRATDRVLGSPDGRWTLASTLMTGSVVATVTWMALAATPPSSRLYEPGHEQVVVPTDLLTRLAEAASGSPAAAATAAGPVRTASLIGPPLTSPLGRLSSSPAAAPARSSNETRTLQFKGGDTIMEVLQDAGVSTEDATAVVDAMRPLFNPRNIRAGQTFEATFGPAPGTIGPRAIAYAGTDEASSERRLLSLTFSPSIENQITVRLTVPQGYRAETVQRKFNERYQRATAKIDSSLYLAAMRAGIPANVVVDLIRMFSYEVDFQRDVQPGDEFEVIFSRFYGEDGKVAKTGDILSASMTLSGKKHALYRFESNGEEEYFDETGQSARSMLMKTPVDGARISSRFGRRFHPVLGYTRMHKGIDFAVPTGTPVMAAGGGVVVLSAYTRGFGNLVVLQHTNGYQTAYGHLSRFAPGVKKGARVRQGQIVAYSGSTGISTGPHLHYEVRVNGAQVNPTNIKMANGRSLTGQERRTFLNERTRIDQLVAGLPISDKLIQAVDLREATVE
jgi:murein DD-endopeptidase MepM/ murein hydrolase activator NlpD